MPGKNHLRQLEVPPECEQFVTVLCTYDTIARTEPSPQFAERVTTQGSRPPDKRPVL